MNYWQKRQQQLNKQLEKDEENLKKRLSSYFDTEYRKLDKQIAAYYKQYGTDNVIQYRRLMESLPDEDKRLLMEQMDEFAKKYPEYASLMPVRESIYRLNRLEGLQYSVRMQQLEIGAVENEQITAHLNRNAERGVNAAAESMGFGKNFYANNPDISKVFINVPWSNGENFSQRIWNNTTKLANYLNSDIAQGIARGDSYERLTRRLRERFSSVSRNDAYRLIYTEGTYVMAEATMQPFKEDFEKYRLSTVGDGKVCSICRGVAREVFNISDRQPGVNFPPLHPWCRCTFTIEVDDWDKWMDDYEKRHGNGEAQKVANRLTENSRDDDDYQERIKQRRAAYRKKNQKKITNIFGEEIVFDEKMSDPKWKESKEMILKLTEQYKTRLRTVGPGAHQAAGRVDLGGNMKLSSKQVSDAIHEFAHSMSINALTKYNVVDDSEFWKEIKKIRTKYRKAEKVDLEKYRISSYADTGGSTARGDNIDEFFAEAFTHAKMRELGLKIPDKYGADFTYSQQVLDVTDKFFGKSVAKDNGSGIMSSGAISGALTDRNDPLGEKRRRHADTYYESIRNSKKDSFVKTISKNSGLSEAYISKVYNHVFVNEYELYGGKKRFAPDYDMAESFRRLRYGKDIQKHDIVLLKHEHLEYGLMNKLHFQYDEAHALAEQKYDYTTALKEFKKKNNL